MENQDPNQPGDPSPPNGATPATPGTGPFYSLAYVLPDGTKVYQDAKGNLFTNSDPNGNTGTWTPYTGPRPNQAPIATPPADAPTKPPAPPPATPTSTTTPTPTPTTSPFGPFTEPFTPPAWGATPAPPVWKDIPTFTDPTMAEVQQEPGFAFGQQQGQQALTQDKAQQGLLYGGGTLKDILAWGTNYATQFYNDARNRMKDTFMTNVNNQYVLPFQQQLAAWEAIAPQTERQNEFQYNAGYQKWLQDYNMWNNNRNYALDVASRLS